MNRKIKTREIGIFEFVEGLVNSRYLIPSFQREFIWNPSDIIRFWESIYNFYPVGNILCWETGIRLNIHRKAGGIIQEDNPDTEEARFIYILDGQQRATSLLLSLQGKKIRIKNSDKFDYSLFFNSKNRRFFFAEEYKRIKREAGPEFLISLSDLFNKNSEIFFLPEELPDCSEKIKNNIRQLLYSANNYRLPVTFIRGFDIPAVSKIYELINMEGKPLKSIDIMIARTFQNYQYLVEEDI